MRVSYKEGDTRPFLGGVLLGPYGKPLDLTNAGNITLIAKRPGEQYGLEKNVLVVGDPEKGEVAVPWVAGDLTPAGVTYAEFIVTYVDGTVLHVPNDGYIEIHIERVIPRANI